MNWFDASPAWLFRLLSTPSASAGNPLSNVHERVGLQCNVTSQWQSSRSERYAEFEEKKKLFSILIRTSINKSQYTTNKHSIFTSNLYKKKRYIVR